MKQLRAASIAAPGFFGLNTQDSSVTLASGFATKAENCVIDKFGRIGARRGWRKVNTSTGNLGDNDVKAIGEVIDNTGNSFVVVAGNNKLFKLVGDTLTELTYGGGGTAPTITDSHWSISTINGILYLFQEGHDPLYFEPSVSTTVYKRISEMTGYTGTVAKADVSLSAYGRLWIASTTTDKNTVQWSDTKLGQKWTAGSSGTLDLHGVWVHGTDQITGLAAHNGNLIIFGRKQLLIYGGAMDPATMTLTEGIDRMGCVSRDSIKSVGNDVFFLSETGVRSLSRTVQEKSMPLNDVSKNVRDDLISDLQSEDLDTIKAVYSPKDAFYIISFPITNKVYCFDTRSALQDGSARVTVWTNMKPKAFYFTRDQDLLIGQTGYVGEYYGFLDNATAYRMQYYTNWFDLESPTNLKFLKKIALTAIGGSSQTLSVKWGFDYSELYLSGALTLPAQTSSYFNIDLYNVGKYSDGVDLVNTKINTSGSGKVLQIGFEADINGNPLSIQKLDIFVTSGKTL